MLRGITIAIDAAALSAFNAYQITELNNEISALKSKTHLLVDISHLHEAHLHHLEEKTDATNKLLADLLESNYSKTSFLVQIKFITKEKHQTHIIILILN
jgi:hypothetical protein